jgi:hypothetical protein
MKILIRLFVIGCLSLFITKSIFSQTLKWTSPSRDDSYQRVGWFILKNSPIESRFCQYDYHTNEFIMMDGALSSTPHLNINLSTGDSPLFETIGPDDFSNKLDYNGDGFNDIVIISNHYSSSSSRYGFRIADYTNGQTLFQLDDASYSYNFIGAFDVDGDGKIEMVVDRGILSTALTETLVYATNGSATSQSHYINDIPSTFQLKQNYPNPCNPTTKIEYQLSKPSNVKINIYDSVGKLVKELINEQSNSGNYSAVWNGKDNYGNTVASGTYFYQIQAGDFVQAKKMILLK